LIYFSGIYKLARGKHSTIIFPTFSVISGTFYQDLDHCRQVGGHLLKAWAKVTIVLLQNLLGANSNMMGVMVKRVPTTEMEVTSIRLERELKEKLKEISGHQGYQALIRDVLWRFVQQKSGEYQHQYSIEDIRATISAVANVEERCCLSGKIIAVDEQIILGWTSLGELVPIHPDALPDG
jgi:predicted DNA-binding protein